MSNTTRTSIRRSRLQDQLNTIQTTLVTQDDFGKFGISKADAYGSLKVKAMEETIFGYAKTSEVTNVLQSYFPCGIINKDLYEKHEMMGGYVNASTNGIEVDVGIDTTAGAHGGIQTHRVLKYRPGYTNTVFVSVAFNVGVADSIQFAGLTNSGSDLFFCYNGTQFGVRRAYGGQPEVRELTITAASSGIETGTVTLNGTEFEVTLSDASSDKIFTCVETMNANAFSGWYVECIGTSILFHGTKSEPRTGSYSFSSTGDATATFASVKTGVSKTNVNVSQSDWNGSSQMINNLDPTMKNLYEIEYSWFGSSNIMFKIVNPDTGKFELVHTMTFANTTTEPSLTSPNLFIHRGIESITSTTAMKLITTCHFGGTFGKIHSEHPVHSIVSSKSILADVETVLLAVRIRKVVNGYINDSESLFKDVAIAVEGTKYVKIKFIKNPITLGAGTTSDYPHYINVDDSNSLIACDVNAKSYTGGVIEETLFVQANGVLDIDLSSRELGLFEHDVIIITGTSSANNDIELALTVLDDL